TSLIDNLKKINFKHRAVVLWLILLVVIIAGIKTLSFSRSQSIDSPYQEQLSSANPSVEISKLMHGKAALEAKKYALAVTLFEEVLAAEPSMQDDVAHFYVDALQGQASEMIEVEPILAQNVLLKLLEIEPANISGLSQLGYIYTTQENYVKAIDAYQKVTKLDAQLPDAFFNLGYVYAITEDFNQAKAMYSRVVELAPSYTDEALFNLAVIQEKLGEHDQCLKNLELAVALNPANESAISYLHRLNQ
ncbi:MAG: tetratricopeptide repeat protein, partial [Desulfobacterales bacterium]